MSHLIPYAILAKNMGLNYLKANAKIHLTQDEIIKLVRATIRATPVDEEWYRRVYPDVDAAIRSGLFRSAKQHFVENGYFEGRRPFEPTVDAEWYTKNYKDVAEGITSGSIQSAQQHFLEHGYDEGREPGAL